MIAEDLRVEGFDARSWTNLIGLFAPGVVHRIHRDPAATDAPEVELDGDERPAGDAPSGRPSGSVVVVVAADGRVRKAFHSQRGRIAGLRTVSPGDLAGLAERFGARRAIVMREGAMEEIAERVAVRLTRGEDYIAQWLVVARALREVTDEGLVHVWPRPLAAVPIPTAGMIHRALDTVLPDDRSLVLVVWHEGQPWTGVVLRRRRGEIDLVAGPDRIARWSGPLGGDFRRDHRFISAGVGRAVAPVHLGIYAELGSLRRLLRTYEPGAWARAVATREILVQPAPAYVAVALGADATRAVAHRTADWLGGIDALAQFAPVARYVRGRVSEIASVTQTLGFDPLRVLSTVLSRADAPDDEGPSGDADAL